MLMITRILMFQEYEEAIKRDPTNAAYHNNRAAALAKLMDFTAAKAACEKVGGLGWMGFWGGDVLFGEEGARG